MVEEVKISVDDLRGRPLGRVLVKMGKLTREQVHEALETQKAKGGPFGQILLDMELIDEDTRSQALAGQAGMEFIDIASMEIPETVLSQIQPQMANAYKVVPIEFNPDTNELRIAMASPDNFRATDDLRTLMGFTYKRGYRRRAPCRSRGSR